MPYVSGRVERKGIERQQRVLPSSPSEGTRHSIKSVLVMDYNKEEISLLLDKENVSHKWFDLPEALILNIYDKTIDACLFTFVLHAMAGEFVVIERTTEFIQVKRYKN